MFKRFLSIIFVALAFSLAGQEVKLPSQIAGKDQYANLHKIDLTKHLPVMGLKELLPPAADENAELASDLLDFAHTFLGTRYRRGGKTPKGFDCSGFTGYIFNQFGYRLGASSRDQFNDGVKIDNADIQPGDLLFFKGRSAASNRIGHVGIAIDSDPETGVITFIHSSCSSGISIDRTSAPYYAKRFVGARRVIGQ